MNDLPPPTPPSPDDAPPPPPSAAIEPPPAPPPEPPAAPAPDSSDDPQPKDSNEKSLAMVMHLIPIIGTMIPPHIGILAVLPPLIFWLLKRDTSPYLNEMGKEVINFQINVGAIITVFELAMFVPFLGCLVLPLVIALGIAALVIMIMAAIAVNGGKFYRYPWILRFVT